VLRAKLLLLQKQNGFIKKKVCLKPISIAVCTQKREWDLSGSSPGQIYTLTLCFSYCAGPIWAARQITI